MLFILLYKFSIYAIFKLLKLQIFKSIDFLYFLIKFFQISIFLNIQKLIILYYYIQQYY